MSEEIKMSDVFELPISCEEVADIGVESFIDNEDCYAAHAINNHDRLTKIETDRKNAISKMSKSWRHDAESQPDLLSRFVDMANRQFNERDVLLEAVEDFESVLSRVMLECSMSNELSEDIEKLLNQIGENK